MNQERRLQLDELAQHAYATYPYYKRILGHHQQICFDDLPIIDKKTINAHRACFEVSQSVPLIESFTSGSTGIPFRCIKSAGERLALSMAIFRKRHEWGLPKRYRSVLLGNSLFAEPRLLSHYAHQMVNHKPHMIQGRCSGIYELAKYIVRKNILVPSSLKFLQNWGEYIQPAQRTYIEEVFSVPLLDYYGMEEIWLMAFTNQQGLLEVDEQLVHMETIDPETGLSQPLGNIGELIVTSLIMKSLPFLRYRTGDIGRLSRLPSSGKLVVHLMPMRSAHIILENRTVNTSVLRYLDRFYQELAIQLKVEQFQLVQDSYTTFRLLVVIHESSYPAMEQRLNEAARRLQLLLKQCLLQNELMIQICRVPRIESHPISGKFQPFVSLVS